MNAPHLASDTLDRYALGMLPDDQRARADAHLGGCARCKQDLSELQTDMQHFNQFVLPRTQEKVRDRVLRAGGMFKPQWWLAPAFALAGAMTIAVIFIQSPSFKAGRDLGVKGGPLLEIFALAPNAQSPVALTPQARVSPGDRLQFVAEPAGYDYLLIVSVDGTGEVSAFYPPEGKQSGAVEPGKKQLPNAIELDAAPGPERVFAYFSKKPLSVDALAKDLRSHPEQPPVPEGAAPPVAFTLEKVAR